MTFVIDIQNEAGYAVNAARLKAAASAVLSRHDVEPGSGMTIVVTDNEAVKALNKQFRDVDAPTDVLSFPADVPPVMIPGEAPYLGDLIVAYPYTMEQAGREGHNPDDSLLLLVVHGTLHLLGYDHDTPENRARMWAAQETILRAFGVSPAIVPDLESDVDER